MIPLYTDEEFHLAKSRQKLPLQCISCKKTFYHPKRDILRIGAKNRQDSAEFCSNKCQQHHQNPPVFVNCKQCNNKIQKQPNEIGKSKSGNTFCNKSCAAKWNNAHKKHGTRRSKLEAWLEKQLIQLYPTLDIHFNRKDAINSELDIYIPSLKLAFELNGIFHYEPIYGQDKLDAIKSNDHRKFAACHEASIGLCSIDTSRQKYFKPKTSQKYLDIITDIINSKLLSS